MWAIPGIHCTVAVCDRKGARSWDLERACCCRGCHQSPRHDCHQQRMAIVGVSQHLNVQGNQKLRSESMSSVEVGRRERRGTPRGVVESG